MPFVLLSDHEFDHTIDHTLTPHEDRLHRLQLNRIDKGTQLVFGLFTGFFESS